MYNSYRTYQTNLKRLLSNEEIAYCKKLLSDEDSYSGLRFATLEVLKDAGCPLDTQQGDCKVTFHASKNEGYPIDYYLKIEISGNVSVIKQIGFKNLFRYQLIQMLTLEFYHES